MKMKLVGNIVALVASLALVQCSSKQKFNTGTTQAVNDVQSGGVTGNFIWVKNKGEHVDLLVNLHNDYPYGVSFDPRAVKLSFNGAPGVLKKVNLAGYLAQGGMDKALVVFSFKPSTPKVGEVSFEIPSFKKLAGENEKGATLPALIIKANVNR